MVILSHPTGNQNVRQALLALEEAALLQGFYTTVTWNAESMLNRFLPASVRSELSRRSYPQVPGDKIHRKPFREAARLVLKKLDVKSSGSTALTIAGQIDRATAEAIRTLRPTGVYAYEGVALHSFREAKKRGTTCIYELPSGYWYYEIDLLREEAGLQPDYADTLSKLKDSREHLEAKDAEIALADHIVVPSKHVCRTLQTAQIRNKEIRVIPYGANESHLDVRNLGSSKRRKFRVLFVGALTQRKGISYVLEAVERFGRHVDFTLIGSRVGKCRKIDNALKNYRWLPSIPHATVLKEMAAHDVLVLPSLSEGFALVISEALSRGLPVITTVNSGAEEIVRDGKDGYFVPIRSSEAIAVMVDRLRTNHELLDALSSSAVQRSRELNWQLYRQRFRLAIADFLQP